MLIVAAQDARKQGIHASPVVAVQPAVEEQMLALLFRDAAGGSCAAKKLVAGDAQLRAQERQKGQVRA